MAETTDNKIPKLDQNAFDPIGQSNRALDFLDAMCPQDFLTGLQLEWAATNAVNIRSGAAWVSGTGRLKSTTTIQKTGLSLSANTWYHLYLYNSGTLAAPVAAVEVSTVAPEGYFGTAYRKTGDATRRYLGSVRTDGSGNIHRFLHNPVTNRVLYLGNLYTGQFVLLTNGSATTETNISAAAVVPVTARWLLANLRNTSSTQVLSIGTSDDGFAQPTGSIEVVSALREYAAELPLDPSQQFSYAMSAAGGTGSVYARGYHFMR